MSWQLILFLFKYCDRICRSFPKLGSPGVTLARLDTHAWM